MRDCVVFLSTRVAQGLKKKVSKTDCIWHLFTQHLNMRLVASSDLSPQALGSV